MRSDPRKGTHTTTGESNLSEPGMGRRRVGGLWRSGGKGGGSLTEERGWLYRGGVSVGLVLWSVRIKDEREVKGLG